MGKFIVGKSIKSWVQGVMDTIKVEFDPKLDPGESIANGRAAVSIELSVGDGGKGSAKFRSPGDEICDALSFLNEWDPTAPVAVESLTVEEIIKRTITAEDDDDYGKWSDEGGLGGVVTFRTSLEKHSRTIKVPRRYWREFVANLSDTFDLDTVDAAVVHYREEVRKLEESARKAAEKAKRNANPSANTEPNPSK